MSKSKVEKLQRQLAEQEALIQSLKIQVVHARDLTLNHMANMLCTIIPHDDNCRDMMNSALDMIRAHEYTPVIFTPVHG
jgi:hypothetical protein